MEIKQYTEKSFVVVGDGTKEYKTQLANLGGRWNGSLKDKETEEKFGGWIFSNVRKEQVEKFLESPETFDVPMKEKNNSTKTNEEKKEEKKVKGGYQRVVYELIIPEKGKDVMVVTGMNMTVKKVAMVMSSRNDGVVDTVYVSNDGNMSELAVVKIVNGEWQMMNMTQEHKVSFVM